MPKQIKKFQCDYCRRSYMRHKAACNHEHICFHNPDRTPQDGELAVYENIPRKLLIEDSYGVPGSDFYSLTDDPEDIEKYKWWPMDDNGPDLGFIWWVDKWHKIKGYKWPHLAPGFSYKPEVLPEGLSINYRIDHGPVEEYLE